jgi:hypothetical protein
MFPRNLSQPFQKGVNGLFFFLGVSNSVVEVLRARSGLFLAILHSNKVTGRLKTMSKSSANLE